MSRLTFSQEDVAVPAETRARSLEGTSTKNGLEARREERYDSVTTSFSERGSMLPVLDIPSTLPLLDGSVGMRKVRLSSLVRKGVGRRSRHAVVTR